MRWEDVPGLVRRCRGRPLHDSDPASRRACHGPEAVRRLLPHRAPFLLLDEITGVDRERRTIEGRRAVRADDPVFAGHFPGSPVYPGVLQVEAMGQLALCLAWFLRGGTEAVGESSRPIEARATRIHHAAFFEPVLPGDALTLHAAVVEDDGLTATAAGQIFRGGTLCSLAVQEVYFVE